MQSLASLMSMKMSDIGNLDDFNDSDEEGGEERRPSLGSGSTPHVTGESCSQVVQEVKRQILNKKELLTSFSALTLSSSALSWGRNPLPFSTFDSSSTCFSHPVSSSPPLVFITSLPFSSNLHICSSSFSLCQLFLHPDCMIWPGGLQLNQVLQVTLCSSTYTL